MNIRSVVTAEMHYFFPGNEINSERQNRQFLQIYEQKIVIQASNVTFDIYSEVYLYENKYQYFLISIRFFFFNKFL